MECIALIVNLVTVEDVMFFVMLLLLSIKWRSLCFSSRATLTKPGWGRVMKKKTRERMKFPIFF